MLDYAYFSWLLFEGLVVCASEERSESEVQSNSGFLGCLTNSLTILMKFNRAASGLVFFMAR